MTPFTGNGTGADQAAGGEGAQRPSEEDDHVTAVIVAVVPGVHAYVKRANLLT